MAAQVDSQDVFNNLVTAIVHLHFGRTENDRNVLKKTLDDLNSLNYRYTIVTNPTKAVLLINQCCTFIPPDDASLIKKFCHLLRNLINHQNIAIEGRTWTISVQWALKCLQLTETDVVVDVLMALDSLLRSNVPNIPISNVTKEMQSLLDLHRNSKQGELILWAINCLEACTIVPDNGLRGSETYADEFKILLDILLNYLIEKNDSNLDSLIYSKILILCLSGLQNIVTHDCICLDDQLGMILGVIKTYMLYGIQNIQFMVPKKLMPSTLSVPEIVGVVPREKKGGKLTKQRKNRPPTGSKKVLTSKQEWITDNKLDGYIPATQTLDNNSDYEFNSNSTSRLKTSDSDFSDTEGGKLAKLSIVNGRVRQASLNLFYIVVKNTEKPVMFSYWSAFIPEVDLLGRHSLVTCFLKDPSARSRMAALNVLLLLLTSSKLYLSQAETSEKSTAFTPFSVILGLTLKQLHNGLSLALNELSFEVLTQVLKCLAALVQATPYHRLTSGIITKIVRNVKGLIYHKDATVQVTALIVLGCVLASEPTVPETKEIMLKLQHNDRKNSSIKSDSKLVGTTTEEFDFAEFSSEDEIDDDLKSNSRLPWLVKRCLSNIGVCFDEDEKNLIENNLGVPAPVKLESLQVLSAMSRNYFDSLLAPNLIYITKALDLALSDRYTDVRLHAGRAVDFIGQAMSKYLNNEEITASIRDQCLQFWQTLLNKSLINLLQCESLPVLRAVGCDCLGSIGSHIYEQLPRNKQILCVTLLFSCTRDDENSVKGAAVRALAICVLYPSLREDPGFVVDTSEAIYRTLQDENLMVRIKSSWSLGNLSDALVLNNKSEQIEEIPKNLLLKLISASISGASDSDKIKMNAVRALGNLLQLITIDVSDKVVKEIAEDALKVLVKNCTSGSNMKVRWNSCYALGNVMKNPEIYELDKNLLASVFNGLLDLVVGFRNFKVRINAAVALSSPCKREFYGSFFIPVWESLLKALDNSQQMEDFSEYKHRDHLIEQICLTLGHITNLLDKEDILLLQEILDLYIEIFKNHMHKVMERIVPEKSTTLFTASFNLIKLNKRHDLVMGEKTVVTNLIKVFKTEDF